MNQTNLSINTTPVDHHSRPAKTVVANDALLQNLLNGSLILGTILFFLNMYNSLQENQLVAAIVIFIAYGIIFLVTFARMLPFSVRVGALSGAYFLVGAFSLFQSGVNGNALLYMLVSILVLAILEKRPYWIVPVAASILLVSTVSYLYQIGSLVAGATLVPINSMLYWISIIVNFSFLIILVTAPVAQYNQRQIAKIAELEANNGKLEQENRLFSQEKHDFEVNLDRRRLRLVTTRQISREISHQTDIEKLLHDSVELIRSQLEYQHVAIYLNDERDENSFLKAAAGEGSQSLLDRIFRIRIHEPSVLSMVISHGEAHISNNLSQETLPVTASTLVSSQSELAVPLRVGQRIIGALDVQSDFTDTFGDEDIEMLQAIADQLATVIDKNTQIQLLKSRVSSLEESYRSYTRDAWRGHLKGTKEHLSYVYTNDSLETEFEQPQTAEHALNSGEMMIAPAGTELNPEQNESLMSVPIVLRDEVLGVLNIRYRGNEIPGDLTTLLNNASDRLALALENARLLEQIQERADREHLVGEISAKLRSASDIDSILRTTASELGKSLGIDEVRVQLKSAETK
jgi:FOG: GAF domain